MSFRERSAWVSAASTFLVWAYFFVSLVRSLAAGQVEGGRFLGLFAACTFVLIVLHIVIAIGLALHLPGEAHAPADEREQLIELKATRHAFSVLSLLAMTVAVATPFIAAASPELFRAEPVTGALLVTGCGILFAVVVAELVRAAGIIFYFRRAG